jgi:nicotinamidase-related amidase
MKRIHLFVIDPQADFCSPSGSLYVDGADKDMDRLALFIKRLKNKLDDIHVTMDSHHMFDVAHPIYWVDSSGKHPGPFTVIKVADMKNGTWNTSVPSLFNRTLAYLEALEANKRYDLMIWPPHCLIGSPGNNIDSKVFDALLDWESCPGNMVDYVTKGSNPFTEHYSAIQAEVPDPNDPTTQINSGLIKTLMEADEILIAGEASSHCVANTTLDTANNFGDDSYIKKLVFLKDASSPVPIAKVLEDKFLKEMTARGMRISTTVDYLK